MSYLDSIGEIVLYKAKIHWIIFIKPIVALFFGFFSIIIASKFYMTILVVLGIVLLIYGVIATIGCFIYKISTELGILEKRVVGKWGFIKRNTIELKLDKTESARIEQSILGRILNYGTVIIIGTGGSPTPFKFIANPLEFRKKLYEILN